MVFAQLAFKTKLSNKNTLYNTNMQTNGNQLALKFGMFISH